MSGAEISLDGLTVDQKLLLMEQIWADLSRHPDSTPSPEWHGDLLAKRRQSVLDGKTEFEDWHVVRERLLKRYS